MTDWVIQRDGPRWSAGYVDGNSGFHHKFDTLAEALEQATWNWKLFDTLRIVDEFGAPLHPGQWLAADGWTRAKTQEPTPQHDDKADR